MMARHRSFLVKKSLSILCFILFLTSNTVLAKDAIGFTWVKAETSNVLVSPWPAEYEQDDIVETRGQITQLKHVPGSNIQRGDEVWIFHVGSKSVTKNQITGISTIEGHYRFDGRDIALEVLLKKDLATRGKHVLLSEPLKPQGWKIKRIELDKINSSAFIPLDIEKYRFYALQAGEIQFMYLERKKIATKYWRKKNDPVHILLIKRADTWESVYEDRKWSLEISEDFNHDGFPEFYAPYPDSADANIISIYGDEQPVNIKFYSGH